MNTTELVVEIRPERNSGHMGFEPIWPEFLRYHLFVLLFLFIQRG